MWLKCTRKDSVCDDFYRPIDPKDKTWKSVIEQIECELEDAWFRNDESIIGISLGLEIVDKLPDGIDLGE